MTEAPIPDDLSEVANLLHTALAKDLLKKVQAGEASAAELGVARQFLKDNGIDTIAKKGSKLAALGDALPFDDDEISNAS